MHYGAMFIIVLGLLPMSQEQRNYWNEVYRQEPAKYPIDEAPDAPHTVGQFLNVRSADSTQNSIAIKDRITQQAFNSLIEDVKIKNNITEKYHSIFSRLWEWVKELFNDAIVSISKLLKVDKQAPSSPKAPNDAQEALSHSTESGSHEKMSGLMGEPQNIDTTSSAPSPVTDRTDSQSSPAATAQKLPSHESTASSLQEENNETKLTP